MWPGRSVQSSTAGIPPGFLTYRVVQRLIGLSKAKSEDSNGRSVFFGKAKDSHNPSQVTLEAPVIVCLFALPTSGVNGTHLFTWVSCLG